MTEWIFLWKLVLILGLLFFSGMAIWVTCGGVKELLDWFK